MSTYQHFHVIDEIKGVEELYPSLPQALERASEMLEEMPGPHFFKTQAEKLILGGPVGQIVICSCGRGNCRYHYESLSANDEE